MKDFLPEQARRHLSPGRFTLALIIFILLGISLAACGDSTNTPEASGQIAPINSVMLTVAASSTTSSPASPLPVPTATVEPTSVPTSNPTATIQITPIPATKTPRVVVTRPPTPTLPAPTLVFNPKSNKTMLDWAKDLEQNIKPANTDYQHKNDLVTWAGQNGATTYASRTDCSGLINALLTQTYGLTTQDFKTWLKTTRPLAIDYETSIANQSGFKQIPSLSQVQPGDLLAIKYPPGSSEGDDTGHIVVITGVPQPRKPTAPEITNTLQWDIPVIDSAESGHGKEDSRYNADGSFRNGLGTGTFRLYTTSDGKLVGYSWSDFGDSLYYDEATRPFAIGRIDPGFKLVR